MKTEKDLVLLVRKEIEKILSKEQFSKTVLEARVTDKIKQPVGGDVEWFTFFEHKAIKSTIDSEIRRVEKSTELEGYLQEELEGMEYLQEAYSVMRGDEPMLVVRHRLTDEELAGIEEKHRKDADAHTQHADEIYEYRKLKSKHDLI